MWEHTYGIMQDTNDLINVCIEFHWYVLPKHKYFQINKMTGDSSIKIYPETWNTYDNDLVQFDCLFKSTVVRHHVTMEKIFIISVCYNIQQHIAMIRK